MSAICGVRREQKKSALRPAKNSLSFSLLAEALARSDPARNKPSERNARATIRH